MQASNHNETKSDWKVVLAVALFVSVMLAVLGVSLYAAARDLYLW